MDSTTKTIKDFLCSDDPLTFVLFEYLVQHHEEDLYVDYKLTFHPDQEKDWLELTKDVLAFANSSGGYLVFGIKNATYDLLGLDKHLCIEMCDTDKIMKKLNRYIDPPIRHLRAKRFEYQSKDYVVLFIPESKTQTHVIAKDGLFRHESGAEKVLLHKGTFYVRKCGGNDIAGPRDIEDLITKRIDYFKTSLFDKISRVIEAPPDHEVFLLQTDPTGEINKRFIIKDAPNSIPIKGMSFTVAPTTPEEEVAAHVALLSRNPDELPPPASIWKWYENRSRLNLSCEHKLALAHFSVLLDAPVFYWIQNCNSSQIGDILCDLLFHNSTYGATNYAIHIAYFLCAADVLHLPVFVPTGSSAKVAQSPRLAWRFSCRSSGLDIPSCT